MAWYWRRAQEEKRRFIEERMRHRRPVLAVALIFIAIWLSGWVCSALLLQLGMSSLPGRYALATLVSYAAFVGLVGLWARHAAKPVDPARRDGSLDGLDFPGADGEGCLIVLGVLLVGLLLSGIFWWVGGYAMLFEVAFEVAFAGTIVHGLNRRYTLGDWSGTLLRKTWLPATLLTVVIVAVAAKVQATYPEAQTLAQAFRLHQATRR
jgi:hypothetical protein